MADAMRGFWLAMLGAALGIAGCSGKSHRETDSADVQDGGIEAPPQGSAAGTGASGMSGSDFGGSRAGSGGSLGFGGMGASAAAGTGGGVQFEADAGAAPAEGEDAGRDVDDELPVAANPFVLAAYDALSTFGADVDTASYDIFTRDLALGSLPSPHSVRLEDFVNYFAYDYPAPAADAPHPFAITLAAARGTNARQTVLLRVGIQAELPPPIEKKQAHIVFLVDVSGSMTEELPLVQSVLRQALDELETRDRISIVTYAGSTEVRLPPTPLSDRSRIEDAIAGLRSGGGTNGASGIQLAYAQAAEAFMADGINHVVLCTDGDFNIGASSDEALVELITEKRATGVTLTALGFGSFINNDSMMEKVSNAGNGIYSVIATEAQAARYVEDRLLATLVHVAKDMKIQVEFNPALVHAYRLLGYENRAIADVDFRNDAVDAGEVGAGHRVTALYELVLAGEPLPEVAGTPARAQGETGSGAREVAAADLALVKVRYKAPGATASDPASEVSASIAPAAISADAGAAEQDLRWAAAIAAFAEILKQSAFGEASEDALDGLGEVFEAQRDRDDDRAAFADQFVKARALLH